MLRPAVGALHERDADEAALVNAGKAIAYIE
jgi:hypothetical protein